MSKQTSRIFKEMPLIEKLLHQSISDYDPTCDDAIDEATTSSPRSMRSSRT